MNTIVVTQQGNVLVPSVQQNRIVTPVVQNTPLSAGVTLQVATSSQQTVGQTLQSRTAVPITTPGPQGPQGPTGGAAAPVYATALTNLTYPCVVAVDNGVAHYADPTNYADMTSQLAITSSAALAGAQVTLITGGAMTQAGWNWAPGRVYLALTGGALTQTPDASASVLEVGRVLNPTTIEFGIAPAVLR